MRMARRAAMAVTVAGALLLGPVGAAIADDPTPAPSATATDTPIPPPVTPAEPPVTPPAPPVTPPAPATPANPPIRQVLPLKKGHFGWMVAKAQQRLQWLGYNVARTNVSSKIFGTSTQTQVKQFQTKFWLPSTGVIDERTWSLLARLAEPVGSLPSQCTSAKVVLCADKTAKLIRFVVGGKIRLTIDARFGLPGMDTGEGTFYVTRKSRDHVSSLYHTWMPFAMFFNGGQAVHYSPYFQRDGYNGGSHGCIGMRDIKIAAWIFDRVPIGSRVYVYRS